MGVFACCYYSKIIFTVLSRENKCEKAMAKQFLDSGLHGAT